MFNTPIRHVPLTNLGEVYHYSIEAYSPPDEAFTFCVIDEDHIAFTNTYGTVFITPYRNEVPEILSKSDYKRGEILVSLSENRYALPAYQWIRKIADEENAARTYEVAYEKAKEKGIKPFSPDTRGLQIKEIPLGSYYQDDSTNIRYNSLEDIFFRFQSGDNIGTYIIVNEKTLVVCDEYSRTFLIKTKYIINDIVNNLINAGYTRTLHPEWYIKEYISTDAPEEE